MGARYATSGAQATNTTTYKTALGITTGTTVRARVYDILWGQGGTPADNSIFLRVMRSTAAGTSTSVTPTQLDPADVAARVTSGENHTVEPTYTAGSELFEESLNQRASFRWIAAPGGELIVPAVSANGLGVAFKSAAYTSTSEASLHFEE